MPLNQIIEALDWIRQVGRTTGAFEVMDQELEPPKIPRFDAAVMIRPADSERSIKLLIEEKKRLTPREAETVVAAIAREQTGRDGVAVVCCPFISQRVAEILTREGIGYVDQAGNARISGPGLFLHVTGQPNLAPDTRPLGNAFASKASRVARVMLEEPSHPWHVQDLAQKAAISIGLASKAKEALIEENYLSLISGFLRVSDPDGMLNAWAKVYRNTDDVQNYYVMADDAEVEARIRSWCSAEGVDCALADYSGAWRLSPMVRRSQTNICVAHIAGERRTAMLDHVMAKSVESGSNLTIRFAGDPFVFYKTREIEGVRVLSPLQLYLDLNGKKGRGEEAAKALYDQLLRDKFQACRNDYAKARIGNGR